MSCNPENWTLEDLLRMQVESYSPVRNEPVTVSPEFRVAVQEVGVHNVRIIIHASGHNSPTLDLIVIGNQLFELDEDVKLDPETKRYIVIENEEGLIDTFGKPGQPYARRVPEDTK